jgi:hypothetical protein
MTDTGIIITLAIFCLWQGSGIVFVLKNRKDAVLTRRGKILFGVVALVLAALRLSAYWYLGYRARTHTQYELGPLMLSLLPDGLLISAMNLTNPDWAPAITYTVIFFGSFGWAIPILLFTSGNKQQKS